MAIFPEPRENLLVEATAMPERGEFCCPGHPTLLFLGFRTNGAASLYFDQDPVLHFNRQQHLRRLFWGGQQYAAQQGQLVHRQRSQPGGRVTLSDHPLSADQQETIWQELDRRWAVLVLASRRHQLSWGGTTVAAERLEARLLQLVEANRPKIFVADDPGQ